VFGLGTSPVGLKFFENDKMSLFDALCSTVTGASMTAFALKGADNMSEDFSHGGVLAASSSGVSAASPTDIAVEPPSAFSP
jgi:hypothetical protein